MYISVKRIENGYTVTINNHGPTFEENVWYCETPKKAAEKVEELCRQSVNNK